MASKDGQATLRGRFRPGTRVRLFKGKDDGSQLHPNVSGQSVIDTQVVDEDGCIQFTGLDEGGYYFAYGYINGQPQVVRLRGRSADDEAATVVQTPVQLDQVRHRDGTIAGERGEPKVPVVRQAEHDDEKKAAIKQTSEKAKADEEKKKADEKPAAKPAATKKEDSKTSSGSSSRSTATRKGAK